VVGPSVGPVVGAEDVKSVGLSPDPPPSASSEVGGTVWAIATRGPDEATIVKASDKRAGRSIC